MLKAIRKKNKRQTTRLQKEEKKPFFMQRLIYIVRQNGQNWSMFRRTFKVQKTLEKQLYNHINFFYAKKNAQKKDISKLTKFEEVEKWPFCKGYSRAKWWKMVYFGADVDKANNKRHSKSPLEPN